MPKKILFIIPPYFNVDDLVASKGNFSLPAFTTPYGVLSLVAYVKGKAREPVDFDLLDLNLEAYKRISVSADPEALKSTLKDLIVTKLSAGYDIVGISALFNSSYHYLPELFSAISGVAKAPPLCIMGGGLASNLYPDLLRDFNALDAVCVGEGEMPLLELVDSCDMNKVLSEYPAWITRNSLAQGQVPRAVFVHNLDEIPMFDYSLIDLNDYNARSLDKTHCGAEGKREMTIHTSRGCPFNCVFCANSSLHGKTIRYMSEDRVISEVDNMIRTSGMNVLLIEDDHFLSNRKRAKSILKELNKRGIRVEFPNGIAVYAIDDEIAKLLKQSGVTTVQLAVESCCDYVLKTVIDKPHTVRQIREAVRILRENGILVHAFIVIGLPGEMPVHREESLRTIKDIGFDWVYFFIAAPIVGSRLYQICMENGYMVKKDYKNHIVSRGSIKAPGVDPQLIERQSYIMNLDVNFLNNYNVRNGYLTKARPYFEHIVNKYPGHALAYYVLAVICQKMLDNQKAAKYMETYERIINTSSEWRSYVSELGLR